MSWSSPRRGPPAFWRTRLHELERPRPASEQPPTASRPFRYNQLPEGDDQVAVCCAAARSTIKRRTCVLPTVTTTCRRTGTTTTDFVRRVPCLARIHRMTPAERAAVQSPGCRPASGQWPGQMKCRPGRSGRPQGSKALPGFVRGRIVMRSGVISKPARSASDGFRFNPSLALRAGLEAACFFPRRPQLMSVRLSRRLLALIPAPGSARRVVGGPGQGLRHPLVRHRGLPPAGRRRRGPPPGELPHP